MGNGTFLYFVKEVFLIFPEVELSSLQNKKIQERTSELEKIKTLTLKKLLIFCEMERSSSEIQTLKTYILGGNFKVLS